jgi:uncharacterized membrane-anchored protein YjiN (DUF445 family)
MTGSVSPETSSSQSFLSTLNRYSSQNSLIELLSERIVDFIQNPQENSSHRAKIERVIKKLLSDPDPNKQWILSLIVELKTHEETLKFYEELKQIID